MRAELLDGRYGVGDFEFARHGIGTGFESFMVLGAGDLSHLQQHRANPWTSIAKNPRWLGAQVPFAELSDKMRVQSADRFRRHAVFQKDPT